MVAVAAVAIVAVLGVAVLAIVFRRRRRAPDVEERRVAFVPRHLGPDTKEPDTEAIAGQQEQEPADDPAARPRGWMVLRSTRFAVDAIRQPFRRPRRVAPQAVTDEAIPPELFKQFFNAETPQIAKDAFNHLMAHCGDGAELPYRRLKPRCTNHLVKRVFELLDKKLAENGGPALAGRSAIVCGGGPCGLRTAVELALQQARVTVLERRPVSEAMTRLNRVHLWDWCKEDIISWGGKLMDPPGGGFATNPQFCHIGIAELQLLMFKNALMLGVDVLFNTEAQEVDEGSSALACTNRGTGEVSLLQCDAVVMVSGATSALPLSAGFERKLLATKGEGAAIGVVANLQNPLGVGSRIKEFSFNRHFREKEHHFLDMERDGGGHLENIVYYKAKTHHYLVMTPTRQSLEDLGVIKAGRTPSGTGLLNEQNIDYEQLEKMVQNVARHWGLPTALVEGREGKMIFDFSGLRNLDGPAKFTRSGVFVCAAGDALLQPFWPQGLGIIRGFMSGVDAASAVVDALNGRREEAVSQMTASFHKLKSLNEHTAKEVFRDDRSKYRLHPSTRYK